MKTGNRVAGLLLAGVMLCPAAMRADTDARDSLSPYGVLAMLDWNHDWNDHMYNTPLKVEHAITMMQEAGVGLVRQNISWDDVEPEKGKFDFEKYDTLIDSLNSHDLRMLGLLCYTALWTGREWNAAPDTDLFLIYVRKVVRRYKDRVKYWEIWNEPDHDTYWLERDGMKSYVALLKAVYPVIKEEDPTAVVVLGSVSTPFPLRDMYRQGAKGNFDIVNVHPFVSPQAPDALKKVHGIYVGVKKVMAEFQDEDKPIWFTEIGCPGVEDPAHAAGWWEGKAPTEQQQADWVTAVYGEPLHWPGVQKIFWAFFQETKHFGNAVDNFGLIRRDFTPKPAYEAYRLAATSEKEPPPQ